jgi:class 3 adenylate cyclase
MVANRQRTPADPGKRIELTSQAECAGSIPVIGSILTRVDAVRNVRSGAFGYIAIGERVGLTVGMARRMESVAPPGGEMLSESTARLIEHAATLKDTELLRIKGADKPVRLLAIERSHPARGD